MNYSELIQKSINNNGINADDIKTLLNTDNNELLDLLNAAYKVRYKYYKNNVKIHVLNNVQSGNCSENCSYCAQSKESENKDIVYPFKNEEEIINEAKTAYDSGAYRYCMVFSGKDLGKNRIEKICSVVKKIKEKYPLELCVSAGFLNEDDAKTLKSAGVNRYNHNINTSASYYEEICTTHKFEDRVNTINTARNNGLDICSGVIIGMGETPEDIVSIIEELKKVKANSIPINFFMPVKGHRLKNYKELDPQYCLKILSIFRLAIPQAELRAAGGREEHIKSMSPLCLYAANSIFAKGYLTVDGDDIEKTKIMIKDAGFVLEHIEH